MRSHGKVQARDNVSETMPSAGIEPATSQTAVKGILFMISCFRTPIHIRSGLSIYHRVMISIKYDAKRLNGPLSVYQLIP